MRSRPWGSGDQLISRRPERLQILEMFASRPLTCGGVQLESDLVHSTRDVQGERLIATDLSSVIESWWKPKVQEVGRSSVDPSRSKLKDLANLCHRLAERQWQGVRLDVATVADQGNHVEIARRTIDQTKQHQAPTADRDEFVGKSARGQHSAERLQRVLEHVWPEHAWILHP